MRVPLSWLAEHVDLGGVSAAVLADRLTFAGIEVERVDRVGEDIAGVLTARVLDVRAHPNADKLVLVTVEAGGEPREVVCGAHNFAPGDVVPWAAPGAKLPGGLEIGRRQVRGTTSDGMLASARELDIFDDHSGILVLPPDTPVGSDLVEALALRDSVLDVKTALNRGDVLSMRGIAREAALVLGTGLRPLKVTVPEAGPPADGLATVEVQDPEGCPLYVARVVEGLDAGRPAPLWMARRLFLYGQRPLGAVVDVTNYLLLDQGQPLHAFDLDLVPGRRIVVRRAADGERLRTLDGRDRVMDSGDTLITAGAEPLAIAGIIGGETTEVRPSTRRVLIESAHFPPAGVRRTMYRLGISTEGGQRWARGVDPAGAALICDQAAALMGTLAGGTVASGRLQAGPGVPRREAIRLDWRRSARRLGAPQEASFAAEKLASVGCTVSVPDPATVVAVPPTWRFDIEEWADLEEEVARRCGCATRSPRSGPSCAPPWCPGSPRSPRAISPGASPAWPPTRSARSSCPRGRAGCRRSRACSAWCWPGGARRAASTIPRGRWTSPTPRGSSRGWPPPLAWRRSATSRPRRCRTIPGAAPRCGWASSPSACSASSIHAWPRRWTCRPPASRSSWS